MKAAAARDKEVRVKGNANLFAAARATNYRRYVLQSSAFWYAPGPELADETASFAFDASPGIAAGCRNYADLEAAAQESGLEAVLLRYGFFYGPGTWFSREGDVGDQVRRREAPVIGKGEGIWNWVHIDDTAAATCAALTADPGVYNVVDDQPVAQSVWLSAFAKFVGAPEPPTVSEEEALRNSGPDSVYYATRPRGARTRKQKASWHSVRDRSNGSGCEQAQRSEEEEHSFLSELRRRAALVMPGLTAWQACSSTAAFGRGRAPWCTGRPA